MQEAAAWQTEAGRRSWKRTQRRPRRPRKRAPRCCSAPPRPPAKAPEGKAEKRSRRAKTEFTEFVVDVWITDLNWIEFGVYKHSRNRAKSRQFTTDMDIFAEVIENGERTGLLGYREDLWKKNTGMDKRLVFKLFNETLNWRATMDLMIGRSLQLTLGARGLPVTVLLAQHRRPRADGLSGALGQQVAAAAGELLVLPARGRQADRSTA